MNLSARSLLAPPMVWRSLALAVCLAWSAAAPAQQPAATQAPEAVAPPAGAPVPGAAAAQASKSANLPDNELTADVLRQLLLAEIAHQRGFSDPAYNTFMDLARTTRDPRVARRAMQIALERAQAQKALNAAAMWEQLAPASDDAKRYVQLLNAAVGKIEPVLPALRDQLAAAADKPQAIAAVSSVVGQIPDKKRAFSALEGLLEPYQDLLPARIALARAAGQAQLFERAETEALAALKLRPGWEYAALLAFDFGARHDTKRALDRLKDFVRQNPAALESRVAYARALGAVKRNDEAKAELEGVLRAAPDNLEVVQRLGVLSYQMQNLPESERYFKLYLEQAAKRADGERDLAPVYGFLAQIAEDQQRYPDAIQWLERIDRGDSAFSAQVRKAVILGKQNKVQAARDLLKGLPQTGTPQKVQVVMAEAQVLRDAKQPNDAYAVLKQAIKDVPENAELLYDYAMAGERLGKYDEMETALRQVMSLKPENAHAYNALGYSLADRSQRLDEAGVLLEKAVALAPDDAFILDSLGWLQYRQGKLDAAVQTLKKAYALRPDAEVAVHLGEVLWVSGDVAGARKVWDEARRKEPSNETLRATLARFNVKL
jgi:tetratricopeptide (TPR) repeat protein